MNLEQILQKDPAEMTPEEVTAIVKSRNHFSKLYQQASGGVESSVGPISLENEVMEHPEFVRSLGNLGKWKNDTAMELLQSGVDSTLIPDQIRSKFKTMASEFQTKRASQEADLVDYFGAEGAEAFESAKQELIKRMSPEDQKQHLRPGETLSTLSPARAKLLQTKLPPLGSDNGSTGGESAGVSDDPTKQRVSYMDTNTKTKRDFIIDTKDPQATARAAATPPEGSTMPPGKAPEVQAALRQVAI